MPAVDLSYPRHIHEVGIGGLAMGAIASVLTEMGHTVTGSDLKASTVTERLQALGIDVTIGHDAANVGEADVVAVSTDIPDANPEVRAARERGIPVVRRADLLAAICATKRTIAVSGTHGKTTTSSMLALVLVEAGLRPSFIIGGDVNEIGSGAVWEDGDLLVVEADESDLTFLELNADSVVVTSVEADHLDHYGDMAAIEAAFATFLSSAPGVRVACADAPAVARLARRHGATTYGTSEDADYRIVDVELARAGSRFAIEHRGTRLGEVRLPVPGLHNASNAAGALVMGLLLGAPFEAAARALARYGGVARRFQFRGERAGVTFVDDYAHNPGKVRAVLAAARSGGWRRVVCVFQPHRYSRVAALWRDFGPVFGDADLVVVTDVFGNNEAPRPGISGKLIVNAILDHDPTTRVAYLPLRADVAAYLRRALRPGDLCITVGAGDITLLHGELLADEP